MKKVKEICQLINLKYYLLRFKRKSPESNRVGEPIQCP